MASGEMGDEQKTRGFAALSSLVSDIDSAGVPAGRPADAAPPEKAETNAEIFIPNPKPQEASSSGAALAPFLWLLGITIATVSVLYAFYYYNSDLYEGPSTERSSSAAANQQTRTPTRPPSAIERPIAIRPFEDKPPIGRDQVLSVGQIRYCLSEKIRLEAAEPVLDLYNMSDVDRFNRYIDDYNSRCGEYRYRSGSLSAARREITPHAETLRAEGIARFRSQEPIGFEVYNQSSAEDNGWAAGANEAFLNDQIEVDSASISELDDLLDAAEEALAVYHGDTGQGQLPIGHETQSFASSWPSVPTQEGLKPSLEEKPAKDNQLNTKVVSAAASRSSDGSSSLVTSAVPIRPPRPSFPRRAAERGISGSCEVAFDLDSRGTPQNVVANCSNPVFVSEAQRAISRTEFLPKMVDGRPVEQLNMVFPLEFVLE